MEVARGSVDLVGLGLHKRKKRKMGRESPHSNEKLWEEPKRGCQYIIFSVDEFYKLKTWKNQEEEKRVLDGRSNLHTTPHCEGEKMALKSKGRSE